MNPHYRLKQPRIRRSVSCDIPLGDGFPTASPSSTSTSSDEPPPPFQRTSPVRRTSSPTHKKPGPRSSLVRSLPSSTATSSLFATTSLLSPSGSPVIGYHAPSSPTKRHSHTYARPTNAAYDRTVLSASNHVASTTTKTMARRSSPGATTSGGRSANSIVSQWTKKRRRQRHILMAKHFVTWFVATLVVGHLGAQLQQQRQRHRSSSAASSVFANKGSLMTLFASSGTKRKRPSSALTPLHMGPCIINGTMYPAPVLPTLLIVGAQKSGTTAMASILAHHELIRAPHQKSTSSNDHPVVIEGHFFDYHYRSLVDRSKSMVDPNEQTCWLRHKYAAQYHRSFMGGGGTSTKEANPTYHRSLHEEGSSTSVVYLEKSPSYLLSPHVPAAVHRLVPEAHILVLLRNPVHRLLSQYRMMMTTQQEQQQSTKQLKTETTADVTSNPRNGTGRSLQVDGALALKASNNLRGGNRRPNQPDQPSFDNLESILSEELRLLQNPVRTYLTKVEGPGSMSPTERQYQFAIPPSPTLGSANYDAYYRWDDLARTPSNFRGFDRLLQRGMYSVQLERWIHALAGDEANAQQVGSKPNDLATADKSPKGRRHPRPKNLIVIPYELFESHPLAVLEHVWRRIQVPSGSVLPSSVLHAKYSTTSGQDHRASPAAADEAVNPEVLEFLHEFYRPYNDRLADLLGEEWRGIWDPRPSSAERSGYDGPMTSADADAANDDNLVRKPRPTSGKDVLDHPDTGDDDDESIDSDPEAWKQAWLHKVLLQ